MKKTDYDLIIVGGGMVGASLAFALKTSSLKIAIIEPLTLKLINNLAMMTVV
jgi:2-polyprenyl-6-methoxyphenol hydroxylase-like FAD-dependent oxidoreductase